MLFERIAVVEALIKVGADPSARSKDGVNPLIVAVDNGDLKVIRLLIKAGAEVDAPGISPLHHAAAGDRPEIARTLITAGADIEMRNQIGQSILHVAVDAKSLKIVEALIKAGAKINAEDAEGHTPLYLAQGGDRKKIANALIKAGGGEEMIADMGRCARVSVCHIEAPGVVSRPRSVDRSTARIRRVSKKPIDHRILVRKALARHRPMDDAMTTSKRLAAIAIVPAGSAFAWSFAPSIHRAIHRGKRRWPRRAGDRRCDRRRCNPGSPLFGQGDRR